MGSTCCGKDESSVINTNTTTKKTLTCSQSAVLNHRRCLGSHLHDAVADGAVRLPAHQQEADYHHHGNRHGHHQQPHHGASIKRLQGVGLLRREVSGEGPDRSRRGASEWSSFISYQFVPLDLGGLVDDLLELHGGVDLRGEAGSEKQETARPSVSVKVSNQRERYLFFILVSGASLRCGVIVFIY